MKIIWFLAVFVLAGLFYVSSVDNVEAGTVGACVDFCQSDCDAGPDKDNCNDLRGEDRMVCNIIQNKLAECCFQECLEDECSIEGSEDVICDLLEEEFAIPG